MAKRPPLTHFLCLPLLSSASRPQFERASAGFRERLKSSSAELQPDVLGRAIRPVGTIHLTLGVMSLTEQERIDDAIKFLKALNWHEMLRGLESVGASNTPIEGEASNDVQSNQQEHTTNENNGTPSNAEPTIDRSSGPFTITLSSLKTMKNASKTSVLYAEPLDGSGRLLPFCEKLRQSFTDAGFLLHEDRPLKLHATILNTLYASNKSHKGPRRKKPALIDATELLEHFSDFKWAEEIVLEKVAICEMGAQRVENEDGAVVDEQYKEVASKSLPS